MIENNNNIHYQVAMLVYKLLDSKEIFQLGFGTDFVEQVLAPAQFNTKSVVYLKYRGQRYRIEVKKE